MKSWNAVRVALLTVFALPLVLATFAAQAADTYTPACRIVQMPTGSNDSTWGTKANAAWAMLEKCATGSVSIDVTSGNVTLTTANNAPDQARNALIVVTGTPGTTRTITLPDVAKIMTVANASDSSVIISAGAGLNVTLGANHGGTIYTDGATNVAQLFPDPNLSSPIGVTPVANGGTGETSLSALSGSMGLNPSTTDVAPALKTSFAASGMPTDDSVAVGGASKYDVFIMVTMTYVNSNGTIVKPALRCKIKDGATTLGTQDNYYVTQQVPIGYSGPLSMIFTFRNLPVATSGAYTVSTEDVQSSYGGGTHTITAVSRSINVTASVN